MSDARKQCLSHRLSMLSNEECSRLRQDIDRCCFDAFNYDAAAGKFCVLAVALNLHNTVQNPTQEKVYAELSKRFQPVNAMKGVPGKYFRENRKKDVLDLL